MAQTLVHKQVLLLQTLLLAHCQHKMCCTYHKITNWFLNAMNQFSMETQPKDVLYPPLHWKIQKHMQGKRQHCANKSNWVRPKHTNAHLFNVAKALANLKQQWSGMVHEFLELVCMNVLLLQITLKHIKDTNVKAKLIYWNHVLCAQTSPCQLLGK